MLKTYICTMTGENLCWLVNHHNNWISKKYANFEYYYVIVTLPENKLNILKSICIMIYEDNNLIKYFRKNYSLSQKMTLPVYIQKNYINDFAVIWGTILFIGKNQNYKLNVNGINEVVETDSFQDKDDLKQYVDKNLKLIAALVLLKSENLKKFFVIPKEYESYLI